MNKQNTLKLGRRVSILSATFLIGLFSFISCKKDESNIGNDINPNGLNILKTDTFTVITYSSELDSLESDETAVSLLGAYNDPEFGLVDCGIVTQVRLSSEAPNFVDPTSITVDSVVLSFLFTSLDYYANLDDIDVEVYQITDDLVRDDQVYYTFETPNTTGSSLVLNGSETISPDPYTDVIVGDDTLDPQIRIHLDPTFGQTLIDNSDQMTTNDEFLEYFKGIYIKITDPNSISSGNGTVLYLSPEETLSKMVVYYTSSQGSKTFSLNINSKCARYGVMNFDRTGTNVEAVLNNPDLGQDKFYMQGSSIRAQFEFPYIMDFQKDRKRIINKAELIMPIQDFQSDVFDPTTALFLARVVDKSTSTYTQDYSSLTTESYDEDNKEYRFIMTSEIQAILDGDLENAAFRVYPTNFFGSTIERIIFNGANSSSKYKTRLEITYTEY